VWVLAPLHIFVGVNFSGVRSLDLRPSSTWRAGNYTSFGSRPLICLAWVALTGAYAPTSTTLRVIGVLKILFHYKAVALEEVVAYIPIF
jgi:hypothetical protein